MNISELLNYLETIAPSQYQESYDNAGLIVGDRNKEIEGVLICLDSTEAIVEEAIQKNCNLIVAHHPIVFKGLKRFTGSNYVERVVMKAIKNEIAIYAIHTNLDNVYASGVNAKIAEKIGLSHTRILAPKREQQKLSAFVSTPDLSVARNNLLSSGATAVSVIPISNGEKGHYKMEVAFTSASKGKVINALQDLQEDKIAYEIHSLENSSPTVGSGMIGQLPKAMPEKEFMLHLKEAMQINCIRHTQLLGKEIKTVALCGGSGGFLLGHAIRQKADIFITADYKYHEFFDADGKIIIADIGHFESEQFTIELLYEIITEKFRNFAAYCTEVTTNPVHYL